MKYFNGTSKPTERPGDLAPLGVKSTIRGNYSFNETFDYIFQEARKPRQEWKKSK